MVRLSDVGTSLDLFSTPVRDWFRSAFAEPTSVQEQGWREVGAGRHVLMAAPTGSGKTLAAFLWCLDRLSGEPTPPDATALRVGRRRLAGQAVEAPQKGGQRLAAPGGRGHQDVAAGSHLPPPLLLNGRGLREGAAKPIAHGCREEVE